MMMIMLIITNDDDNDMKSDCSLKHKEYKNTFIVCVKV